ncbi:hypothetical protein B0H21DRAFT_712041 [Amylocystis lapponica]|nr:hypothetical protein B0H21DRAFT_712041 [Amylocystis lapponica]
MYDLQLGANGGRPRRTSVTLEGLVHLARHCPQLSRLVLALDASVIPDSDRQSEGGLANDSITKLMVRDSSLEDPIAVAAFLSNLFPNLRRIIAAPSNNKENIRKWKMVESALVRRQELE